MNKHYRMLVLFTTKRAREEDSTLLACDDVSDILQYKL